MELSKHFTLEEFVTSNTAIRKGIDNTPNETQILNLKNLCENVLEPLRVSLGKAIKITSGYRCEKLNKVIGGSKNSQHQWGMAADIQVAGMTTEELFKFMIEHCTFDQLIQEFDSWIHISWVSSKHNRNEKLRAIKKNGKTIYLPV